MYGYLADAVVAAHVCYVAYVVLGQFLIWAGWALGWRWIRNRWFRFTHLLMMGIVVYEEFMDIRCPLSVWEEQLRALANQSTSSETFMGRLLHNLIFYDAPPFVFTTGYCIFGGLVLLTLILCPPRKRKNAETPAGP